MFGVSPSCRVDGRRRASHRCRIAAKSPNIFRSRGAECHGNGSGMTPRYIYRDSSGRCILVYIGTAPACHGQKAGTKKRRHFLKCRSVNRLRKIGGAALAIRDRLKKVCVFIFPDVARGLHLTGRRGPLADNLPATCQRLSRLRACRKSFTMPPQCLQRPHTFHRGAFIPLRPGPVARAINIAISRRFRTVRGPCGCCATHRPN